MKHKNQGFTLIEIMLAILIVGILTAVAMPSYNEYIRRGHRADARAGLLQAQQWLERAATATGNYPTVLPDAFKWASDPAKRYQIDFVAGNTATAFTLAATRKNPGAQLNDRCGDFTLTNTGTQNIINQPSASTTWQECWRK